LLSAIADNAFQATIILFLNYVFIVIV